MYSKSQPHYAPFPSTPIPISTATPSFTSRYKTNAGSVFATSRPWMEVFEIRSFTRPITMGEVSMRTKKNLQYFRFNYAMIILLAIFLSLLWYPVSIIIFLVLTAAWFKLYLSKEEPLVLFTITVDDQVLLGLLGSMTILGLVVTGVWLNVLVSILIGAVFIGLHAAFRSTEDLYMAEPEMVDGGLLSVVGSTTRIGYARV